SHPVWAAVVEVVTDAVLGAARHVLRHAEWMLSILRTNHEEVCREKLGYLPSVERRWRSRRRRGIVGERRTVDDAEEAVGDRLGGAAREAADDAGRDVLVAERLVGRELLVDGALARNPGRGGRRGDHQRGVPGEHADRACRGEQGAAGIPVVGGLG